MVEHKYHRRQLALEDIKEYKLTQPDSDRDLFNQSQVLVCLSAANQQLQFSDWPFSLFSSSPAVIGDLDFTLKPTLVQVCVIIDGKKRL